MSERTSGLVGSRIGPYDVRELLGTGGFAAVYRAHDPRLRSDVALKVLADVHALDPEVRERFVAEGHLLRRIGGGSTVQVFDIGETPAGSPFLVLELADRGDLRRRVDELRERGWTATSGDVAHVADLLLDALSALHAERVVHRDVKPSNVLIRSARRSVDRLDTAVVAPDERLLLADLGLAKDLAFSSGLTAAAGSSAYSAPEQLRADAIVDARTDVYAAAGVIATLVGPDLESPRWRAVARELDRARDPDPDRRHSTIEAWHRAVAAALPADTARATDTGHAGRRPRRPLLAVLAVVVVVAALVGATLLLAGREGVPTVELLDDGTARSVVERDGARVAIVGPPSIAVGDSGRWRIETEGIASWTWTTPDGNRYRDVEGVEIAAVSSGRAVIAALGITADGDELVVEFPLEVDG